MQTKSACSFSSQKGNKQVAWQGNYRKFCCIVYWLSWIPFGPNVKLKITDTKYIHCTLNQLFAYQHRPKAYPRQARYNATIFFLDLSVTPLALVALNITSAGGSTKRGEIFSESWQSEQNFVCEILFSDSLAPDEIPFSDHSIGKWFIRSDSGSYNKNQKKKICVYARKGIFCWHFLPIFSCLEDKYSCKELDRVLPKIVPPNLAPYARCCHWVMARSGQSHPILLWVLGEKPPEH